MSQLTLGGRPASEWRSGVEPARYYGNVSDNRSSGGYLAILALLSPMTPRSSVKSLSSVSPTTPAKPSKRTDQKAMTHDRFPAAPRFALTLHHRHGTPAAEE